MFTQIFLEKDFKLHIALGLNGYNFDPGSTLTWRSSVC